MSPRTFRLILAVAALVALIAALAVFALTFQDDHAETFVPAAEASTQAPTPIDHDREACHRLSQTGNYLSVVRDSSIMKPIAAAAGLATDEEIKTIGLALWLTHEDGPPEQGEESVEAAGLVLELDKVCAAKYGDGPW